MKEVNKVVVRKNEEEKKVRILKKCMVVNLFLICLTLGVSSVEAKKYATYKKGDEITVNVNAEEKIEFYVIKDSGSEEQNIIALLKDTSYPNNYTYENATKKMEEYRTLWNNVSEVALPKMIDIFGMDASTLEVPGKFVEPVYAQSPHVSYWLQDVVGDTRLHLGISIPFLGETGGRYQAYEDKVELEIRPIIHVIKENVARGVVSDKDDNEALNPTPTPPKEDTNNNTEGNHNTNNYKVYKDGTVIYYNPETNQICNRKDAVSITGVKTGCMKWYTFNDDVSKTTVNLLLDHNTTLKVDWNSSGNKEIREAKTALVNDTKTWEKQARLITADEIAHIVGADREDTLKWNAGKKYLPFKTFYMNEDWNIEKNIAEFYLDGASNTNKASYTSTDGWNKQVASSSRKSSYAWLYDNLLSCTDYGCNVAPYILNIGLPADYYTSTIVSYDNNDSNMQGNSVFVISRYGKLATQQIGKSAYTGIRPVIAVEKSVLQNNITIGDNNKKVCPNDGSIDITSCITAGKTEAECILMNCPGTEKVTNPKTGIHLSIIILGSIFTLTLIYIVRAKKTYLKKIR